MRFDLTLQDFGMAVLPLYMQAWPEADGHLVPVLADWSPASISRYALFTGQSMLTPKVQILLEFFGEHIATTQDPRNHGHRRRPLHGLQNERPLSALPA